MLSPQDAFKASYIARLADLGMTPEEMLSNVKEAREKFAFLGTIAGKAMDAGKGVLDAAVGWGIPMAAVAPPILGAVAGAGLASATDIDDTDVADVKRQEIVETLRREADNLRRQRAARDYRKAKAGTGRIFS